MSQTVPKIVLATASRLRMLSCVKANYYSNKNKTECCKFCGRYVNLNDEGVTYRDGSCAHEECHDNEEFRRENAADLADHGY